MKKNDTPATPWGAILSKKGCSDVSVNSRPA